ncbi:hypothetical protein GCM10023142_03650 [Anaerocolumna aminovalerica]|uniref:Lipoprotein n=1 Tax=Anaerocolumna aminovalerica TaxID=1527 RepID=A0A1I5BUC2_9FIRM|nr:hypothetical protein [Anaerocolumna aminovalerica]SFN78212.1 hypothetical protein SAMN04489757_101221 [Anaerocolumna aminovalerica]
MFINCKSRKKPKSFSLILCLFLLCLLSGCGLRKAANQADGNQITLSPEPTNTMGVSDRTEEADTNNKVVTIEPSDTSNATEDPKIEDFSEMDKYFKDYTFDVSYDEKLAFYQRTFSIQGAFDLNRDGEADRINAVLKANYEEGSYIEVNGIKVTLDPFNPSGEIQIIDLDSKDSYVEVAIFDEGPSGDPNFKFFQYDGKELYSLGSIDRYALMDGQGKFISWFHLTNYFKPQFFSAWGEFKNKEYVITNHDVEQYIGKTYEVDGSGYFVPLDKNPENFFDHTVWDLETLREFKETKIKLLDIHIEPEDRTLNWFYVELPDGERGLLYFWIGD